MGKTGGTPVLRADDVEQASRLFSAGGRSRLEFKRKRSKEVPENMAGKIKKGSLVRAVREKLENSLEAKASDTRFPPYLFESKGEILDVRGDYAFVKFGKVPTPNIWLRLDQLEEFS